MHDIAMHNSALQYRAGDGYMIILVGSNKGGTGKTTTAINLASILSVNNRVLLCDCDSQQSLYQWNAIRKNEGLIPFDCITLYGDISSKINNLSKKYDVTIIDVAGRNSKEFLLALSMCDLFISPIQVSQLDLNTLILLDEQINELLKFNEKLKNHCYVLHNKATTNIFIKPKERTDLEEFISELHNLKLLNSIISERKIFKDAISEGKGIYEYKNINQHNKAYDEYESLVQEIRIKGII